MRIAAFLRLSSGKGILNTWPRLDLFIPSHFHKVLPSINDSSFNGVQKGQVTDSAFASGNPGMGMATGPCYQESEILLRGNISAHSAKLYEVNVGDRNDSSSYINIRKMERATRPLHHIAVSPESIHLRQWRQQLWLFKLHGNGSLSWQAP